MSEGIAFTVNDWPVSVQADPERSLLEVLREDLGLHGTKYGCGEGQCGACTVLVDGKRTRSCRTTVGRVAGKQVVTIESLATAGKLHPIQAAFVAESAAQCGYCTSGMIMSTLALLREKPHPTPPEIAAWMEGNLCRCCNYPSYMKAIQRAAAELASSAGGSNR